MIILACIAVVSSSLAQENLTALIKEVSPSVVLVITYDEEGEELSGGSGFFISEDGDVITNRHVIQGAYYAEVKTSDEKVYDVKEVLAEDKEGDLVRLSVDIPRDAVHVLGISDSLPEVGERVIVVGNPLGLEQTVSDGIVSAVREIPAFGNIIQITAPISSGSSGSPVVNMKGEVIGVASFQMVEGQNLNFAIPSERIAELAPGKGQTLAERKAAITEEWLASAEGLYYKGLHSLWREDYEEALLWFQKAVKENSDYAEAYFAIGYCKGELALYSEAIDAYKQAIRINPDDADAYFNLGLTYGNLERYHEAIEAYKQAIRIRPDYAEAYFNLGWVYGELGLYSEAIEAYKQATRIKPNYAKVYYNLGWTYAKLGRWSKAIEAYKQVIRINPNYAEAYYNMGVAYGKLGYKESLSLERVEREYRLRLYIEEEIKAYKQAIRINPDYAEAYYNMGLAFYSSRIWDAIPSLLKAIEAYRQVIRIDPNYVGIYDNLVKSYNDLGTAYGIRGRYYEAMDAYRRAIQIKPDFAKGYSGLGLAYQSIGLYNEAIEAYKQAIYLNPDDAYAHYGLGLAYLRTKDTGSALQEYKILKGLDAEKANQLFDLIYP